MDTDSPEFLEQQAVIDIVEASLDVTLNSPPGLVGRFTSSIYDIDDTPDCVFLCPIGAKAVALRIKSRFTDRLDNDTHALLYDPVQYSGDTKRSFIDVTLFDIFTAGCFVDVVAKTILNK